MKKIVPVLIAIILIVVIGVVGFGGKIMDKYSYSKELADMDEYYGVSGNRVLKVSRSRTSSAEEKAPFISLYTTPL